MNYTAGMIRSTIVLFVFSLTSVVAFANVTSCPTLALKNISTATHFDQRETRICFAFVASDLLAYALQKNFLPYDIAIQTFKADQDKENTSALLERRAPQPVKLTGGFLQETLEALQNKRICLNDDRLIYKNRWIELSDLFTFLRSSDPTSPVPNGLIDQGPLKPVEPFLRNVMANNYHISRLERPFNQFCGNNREIIQLPSHQIIAKNFITYGRFGRRIRALSEIDLVNEMVSALRTNNPLGIEYNISSIRTIEGQHASSIIAMKFEANTQQCLALVKDSHGSQCDDPAAGVTCTNGHYWVSVAALIKTLSSTTWLQPVL
ncbi:MAG: hypothetical protein H7061_02115 [Bdellovibrionaceae bacterium]|nr:hypothetical protein [Bdellovibrio sp.]